MSTMKKRNQQLLGGLVVCLIAVFLMGCGPSAKTLEGRIHELENEVTRLKVERANLAARNTALDDEKLLLAKKIDGCEAGRQTTKQLTVVRLLPDEAAPEPPTQITPAVTVKVSEKKNESRPVLVLRGGEPSWVTASNGPAVPIPAGAGAATLGVLGADDLGVVNGNLDAAGDGAMRTFQEGYRAYSNRSYDQSLELFASFIKENPGHDYADNALYWRAECLLAQGNPARALGELERLVRRYPAADSHASALYRMGYIYDTMGDRPRALQHYFQVVEQFPGSDAARKASQRVAAIQEVKK